MLENYREFMKGFSSILDKLESNNNEVIITGDFNIDLLKINDKPIISEYFDLLTSHSFYFKITVPTRLIHNYGTLMDNILCKLTTTTLKITSGVLIKKFSDHQPYFILRNNINVIDQPPVFVRITKQDKDSLINFQNEISGSDELNTLFENLMVDPNINYNILHKVLLNAKNKHMKSKLVKYNKYKHKRIMESHIEL